MIKELTDISLFRGICKTDIETLLRCLQAEEIFYQKGGTIFSPGDTTRHLGVVLEGMALIEHADIWGNNNILGSAEPGGIFGEAYACLPGEPLMIHVTAVRDTRILFINAEKICNTCPASCPFHAQLIRNLLTVCASKSVQLSKRILHTGPKSIRKRLMSYFSECTLAAGSYCFDIPYNRQQLADYLSVDRSALSAELSKMQKDGLLRYHKNHFEVIP